MIRHRPLQRNPQKRPPARREPARPPSRWWGTRAGRPRHKGRSRF